MNIAQCSNGHFYDSDKKPVCPYCEAKRGARELTVGWLVCVSGAGRGAAYAIHPGDNPIGAAGCAFCGSIRYDGGFYLTGCGRSAVRRDNAERLEEKTPLAPYEYLDVGPERLMLVPLCGEKFNWPELIKE